MYVSRTIAEGTLQRRRVKVARGVSEKRSLLCGVNVKLKTPTLVVVFGPLYFVRSTCSRPTIYTRTRG